MTLATLRDLSIARGTTFDPTDEAALLALEAASSEIERYCNRTFTLTTETISLLGKGTNRLTLPNPPVSTVTSVTEVDGEDETLLETTDYVLDGSTLVRTRWPFYSWLVYEVDYTHGFDPIPADVQMACIRMASSLLETSTNTDAAVSKVQLGSFAETYATATATTSALDLERDTLALYRLADVH
jgi:hypothetical protein